MPQSLSSLTPNAQAIFQAIESYPEDQTLLQIAPDDMEFEGYSFLADVMRRNYTLALQMALQQCVPDESKCIQILQLIDNRAGVNIAEQVSQALWKPERPPISDLGTPEGMLAQYRSQRLILASGALPVEDCFEEVRQHLAQPWVQEDLESGPRLLLLVPRRPLAEYVAALEVWLRQNAHVLRLPEGQSIADEPVFLSDRYEGGLEYHCPVFRENGELTFVWKQEAEWMAEKQTDVLVIDPSANLPENAHNRSANRAWANRGRGEVFLTPQGWSMLFGTLLLGQGKLLGAKTWSILAGARFARSENDSTASDRDVPGAYWSVRRVRFDWSNPDDASEEVGVRGSR